MDQTLLGRYYVLKSILISLLVRACDKTVTPALYPNNPAPFLLVYTVQISHSHNPYLSC
jgi:hypothetical protein